jgi:NADP-dependent 3-hydroxy acid dehydrogenase YdfG
MVLAGKTIENLEETKRLVLQERSSLDIVVKSVDLTKKESLDQFLAFLHSWSSSSIRSFINTAAGFYKGSFKEQTLDSVDGLIQSNYSGVVYLIAGLIGLDNYSLPFDIINVTSISSATNLDSSRSSALHISTKAALQVFDKVLGRELCKEGVRITSIAPGTFARGGRIGLEEDLIFDVIRFVMELPAQAWIESIEIHPTGLS